MSNVMPEFVVSDMTTNLILKVDQTDMSLWAKIIAPTRLSPRLTTGSFRLNGNLITITSQVFVKVYPT